MNKYRQDASIAAMAVILRPDPENEDAPPFVDVARLAHDIAEALLAEEIKRHGEGVIISDLEINSIYKAMIAAAPTPPEGAE